MQKGVFPHILVATGLHYHDDGNAGIAEMFGGLKNDDLQYLSSLLISFENAPCYMLLSLDFGKREIALCKTQPS